MNVYVNTAAMASASASSEKPALKPEELTGIQSLKRFEGKLHDLDKLLCKKTEVRSKKNKSLKERIRGVSTNFTLSTKEKNELIEACNPVKEGIQQFLVDYNALQAKMPQRDSRYLSIIGSFLVFS